MVKINFHFFLRNLFPIFGNVNEIFVYVNDKKKQNIGIIKSLKDVHEKEPILKFLLKTNM